MPSILMLDDEPHVVSALRRVLRTPLGPNVTMELFTDAHAALARVGEHAFDLVMSDFRMPVFDGVQFLRFVREIQPTSLRMIVSASTEISGVMSAVNDVGVFRYIVKPWVTELLVQDVRDALDLAAAEREQRRLADEMRHHVGKLDRGDAERRALEAMEPGLTDVEWGLNGEILMPPLEMRES